MPSPSPQNFSNEFPGSPRPAYSAGTIEEGPLPLAGLNFLIGAQKGLHKQSFGAYTFLKFADVP